MKVQPLIAYAKNNVFESTRFYYGMLWVLAGYFLLNRFLRKCSLVYFDNNWVELKVGEGILFGIAYIFILISAWFLRKKIPRFVFWCWGGILMLFILNEIRFALEFSEYEFIYSFTQSQGYYTAKVTLPLLFIGVWSVLKDNAHYVGLFIKQLEVFLVINGVCLVLGAIFNISVFESYPLTERWGYSGLLWHNSMNYIFYGLILIYALQKDKKAWILIGLFFVCLLLLGQKSGLLYLGLIIIFVVLKNKYARMGLLGLGGVMIVCAPYWVPIAVSYSQFWQNVYNKHGAYGALLSLRNENIESVWNSIGGKITLWESILGGLTRFPIRVEMMPFDLFLYFGCAGLLLMCWFFWLLIPKWYWSIPIIVACLAGGLHEAPIGFLIYFLFIQHKELTKNPIAIFMPTIK